MESFLSVEEFYKIRRELNILKDKEKEYLNNKIGFSLNEINSLNFVDDFNINLIYQHMIKTACKGHKTCFFMGSLGEEVVKKLVDLDYNVGFLYPNTCFVSWNDTKIGISNANMSILSYRNLREVSNNNGKIMVMNNAESLRRLSKYIPEMIKKFGNEREMLVKKHCKYDSGNRFARAYDEARRALLSGDNKLVLDSLKYNDAKVFKEAGYKIVTNTIDSNYLLQIEEEM